MRASVRPLIPETAPVFPWTLGEVRASLALCPPGAFHVTGLRLERLGPDEWWGDLVGYRDDLGAPFTWPGFRIRRARGFQVATPPYLLDLDGVWRAVVSATVQRLVAVGLGDRTTGHGDALFVAVMGARIWLTMIVKNEERTLPACLEAAQPWVDEIVVVDTGSTDRTREIADGFGARVHEWAWRDDFAAARNESLRHATGDWILALDADEVLTPESGPALRRACDEPGNVVGYDIKIVCPREGDGGLVRLNWFPRLFRNLPGVRWEGVIHEQVVTSLVGHGPIVKCPVEVLHSGYTLSADAMQAKARRNIVLLERQLQAEPDYAPGWFQLAETYVMSGRLDDAIDAYRRSLRLLQVSRLTLSPGVIVVALQNLGAALFQRNKAGDRSEARHLLESALSLDDTLIPIRVIMGNHAMAEQKWEEAERHFTTALELVAGQREHGEYEISPWLIQFPHGCTLAHQRKLGEAMTCFDQALAVNPRHGDSLWLLALTSGDAGDWARGFAALERLAAAGRDDVPYHIQRAVTLSELGRHAESVAEARLVLEREPTMVPVLSLLAENLTRAGRYEEAVDAYARLVEAAPDKVAPLLALAQCREIIGDRDGMMDAYRRAVALAPDSADVLFALGSACLRSGALDAAEECLAGAVERYPERADFRLNHALCLIKKGDLGRARDRLTAIVERWPEMRKARELQQLVERFATNPQLGRLAASALAAGRS